MPTGADDFLPVLIYLVLKTKPINPISNIEFIKKYRSPARLMGLEDYYFTALENIFFIIFLNYFYSVIRVHLNLLKAFQ